MPLAAGNFYNGAITAIFKLMFAHGDWFNPTIYPSGHFPQQSYVFTPWLIIKLFRDDGKVNIAPGMGLIAGERTENHTVLGKNPLFFQGA